MAAQKPSIPKGTRDFSPIEMVRRNYIFDTIKEVFCRYGYQAIETPAMENLRTLTGKSGEEADKLLFRILNSGNYLSGVSEKDINIDNLTGLTSKICEKGLRYDLTVPFARYVVQHRNDITFPFKRYQIQPVWRADKPQRGRYREFYQCDVDVIGSDSLLNEVELIQIINEVFNKLSLGVVIKLNNRKILTGISEMIGAPDKFQDITIALDKLEKTGLENVVKELLEKGLSQQAVDKLKPVLFMEGDHPEKSKQLKSILTGSETGLAGIHEMDFIFDRLESTGLSGSCELDLTLARGLNYYTGTIIEVQARDAAIGSICGGGRYDDLTGIFGMPDVSGVGVSFGADRIYDVLLSLGLFPEKSGLTSRILFINFGEKEERYCLGTVNRLRQADIPCELYPDRAKLKKQMKYADQKQVPFVVLIGENEMANNYLTVKNMSTGEQKQLTVEELIEMMQ